MNKSLTIGDLGKRVGLPTKTIRFYEEVGLIAAPKRAQNGYRVYETKTVEELQLIKRARDLGVPIEEIKKLMQGCKDGNCTHSKEYIESEITAYINRLDQKIEQLSTLKRKLTVMKHTIDTQDCSNKKTYCCNILGQLVES